MSEELKPCPFCGGEAMWRQRQNAFCIDCSACNAGVDWSTKDGAAYIWNRRTHDHSGDANEMISPTTSVITWTRYDGSPMTLPERDDPVLVSCGWKVHEMEFDRSDYEWAYPRGGWISIEIGDLWAYVPTPPEGA